MGKLSNLAKWGLTLGKEPQTFLGAKWIQTFLKKTPESKKRIWALRILSLSPHYFINPDKPEYQNLSQNEYLETVFNDSLLSRVKIYEYILKNHLDENQVVLDYGCGPGFLARVVAENVNKIYACDISTGALACARILNPAPNLEYVVADEAGMNGIPNKSIDVVFSFAMIQHISDEVFELVLENCRKKLKPGGKLILHIQLLDSDWRTEDQWKSDTSVRGRIKYRYGLHCFGRTKESHIKFVRKHGFKNIDITNIANLTPEDFDDICSQSLLTAIKED